MTMMKTVRRAAMFAAATMAIGAVTPASAATTLYGMNSGGQFFSANPATAATTQIAATGSVKVGLAQSTVTGTAYTRSFDQLYTINLSTGALTTVGASGTTLTGLAFNLAQTSLFSINQSNGSLYSINIATGAASLIGTSGISSMLDLATDRNGVLYGANIDGSIYTLNTTTGAATFVSKLVTEGLTAIDFDDNNVLYGVGLTSDALYSNVLTAPTRLGTFQTYNDVRGLEFVTTGGAVPEPASWAMMILGMGAIGYSLRSAKRRSNAKFQAARLAA